MRRGLEIQGEVDLNVWSMGELSGFWTQQVQGETVRIQIPTAKLRRVQAQSVPSFDKLDDQIVFVTEFRKRLRLLELDHFNERIINTFMPARVLHCWQKQLIRRYRLELAQIQHCFNNSFTSCIYVAQQAKGSAQSLESDIELEKRAQVRMAQKDLQKKEQEALAQQTLEAKQVATRLQQKADQPAGLPSPPPLFNVLRQNQAQLLPCLRQSSTK